MAHEIILIVDDDKDIQELIIYNLKKEGFQTLSAYSGEEALIEINRNRPDCIILDLMLPGIDGIEICKKLKGKEETRSLPIIMLTAKGEDSDIVLGLELDADDYITKPFSPKVLTARIRSILRRKQNPSVQEEPAAPEKLRLHDIEMDLVRHSAAVDGKPVDLSVTEFDILTLLINNPGWVFSRNQIINKVKGSDYPVTERSVDVQILGLRKKLGSAGDVIETVRGVGYRIKEEKHEN